MIYTISLIKTFVTLAVCINKPWFLLKLVILSDRRLILLWFSVVSLDLDTPKAKESKSPPMGSKPLLTLVFLPRDVGSGSVSREKPFAVI